MDFYSFFLKKENNKLLYVFKNEYILKMKNTLFSI